MTPAEATMMQCPVKKQTNFLRDQEVGLFKKSLASAH